METSLDGTTTIFLESLKGSPRFYQLLAKAAVLHSVKNQDYADSAHDPLSNFRACERAGIPAYDGLLTRLSDKNSRLERLSAKAKEGKGASVKSESVVDTHMDSAVYHLLAIILLEEGEKSADIYSGEVRQAVRDESPTRPYPSGDTIC